MAAEPSGEGVPCTVVIADDADDVRLLLRLLFDLDQRFEVMAEARDGREAVDLVSVHRPNVILLDVSMPVMDGLEAIPLIREASEDTKILMFSGLGASHVEPAARALGADGYVEKGLDQTGLVEAVSALCS